MIDPKRKRNYSLNGVMVLLLAGFLYWAGGNLDGYKIQIMNLIAVNIILALSLNLIYGFTGLFSLGHAGFMAIGAYTCSLLILPAAHKQAMFILQADVALLGHACPLSGGSGHRRTCCGLLRDIDRSPRIEAWRGLPGNSDPGFCEIIRVLANTHAPRHQWCTGTQGYPVVLELVVELWLVCADLFVIMRLVRSNFGILSKP
jgi:branched-chain amino acid transport system permease protein